MKIHELLDVWKLQEMIDQGYVRYGTHNEFPELRIYEYTRSAMFDKVWNDVTTKTRGLIVNWDTKEVLARPFDKFFNYGQEEQKIELSLNDEVIVHDKMDGSLGILYRRPDGHLAIATKGSFHSEQAEWATAQIRRNWTIHFEDEDQTWMFEIIYPENKIVLSYDFSGLVLLGVRDIETGDVRDPDEMLSWKGRKARRFYYQTLREALEAPPRPNAEGYVIYLPEMDVRVKLKQEDYLKLHRAVFFFNEKKVYDLMTIGQTIEQICDPLPDELHEDAKRIYLEFSLKFMKLRAQNLKDYQSIYKEGMARAEFASLAVKLPNFGFLFSLFENNPRYLETVWKSLDPVKVKRQEKKGRKKIQP